MEKISRIRVPSEAVRRQCPESDHRSGPVQDIRDLQRTSPFSPPGRGRLESYSLRPGMSLLIMDLYVDEQTNLEMEQHETTVGFALAVEGASRQTVKGNGDPDSILEIRPRTNIVRACYPERTRLELAGGQTHRLIKLQFDPRQVPVLLETYRQSARSVLGPILGPDPGTRKALKADLCAGLECIAHQVITCSLAGAAKTLFLEGKALEILALELDGFSERTSPAPVSFGSDDLERLRTAKRILDEEFSDPPTIFALAKRVGLNDFKLKRGFREIFQTTVFSYVRTVRMEKARALLETGELNVTEVALATGYNNLGHFAAAFRRQFGILPSKYRAAKYRAGKIGFRPLAP